MTQHSSHRAAGTGGPDRTRRDFLKTGAAAVGAVPPLSARGATAAAAKFGFLVISDTHFKAAEDAPETPVSEIDQVNQRLISRLNKLPGQPLER
jgi:hypothetical protein